MISLEHVRRIWIWSIIFVELQIAACCSITVVYAYGHLTIQENAVLHILSGLMACLIFTVGKTKTIRKWIIKNYPLMAIGGMIIDGGTELCLLISPFVKMICDVVALGSFFKFYRIQMVERLNVIFDDDGRVKFDLDMNRAGSIGIVAGGLLALLSPKIDIEYVIWISAIWTCLTYVTSWYRFWICDQYMKQQNIMCPCMKEK